MVKVYMAELKENGQTKARKVFADAKEAADCALKTKEKSMTAEEEVKQLIQDVKKYNLPEVTTDYKFLTKVGPLPTAEEICKNLRASKAMKELTRESAWNGTGFAKGLCSVTISRCAELVAARYKDIKSSEMVFKLIGPDKEEKKRLFKVAKEMVAFLVVAAIHAHAISDEERTKSTVDAARASIIYIERYQEKK